MEGNFAGDIILDLRRALDNRGVSALFQKENKGYRSRRHANTISWQGYAFSPRLIQTYASLASTWGTVT